MFAITPYLLVLGNSQHGPFCMEMFIMKNGGIQERKQTNIVAIISFMCRFCMWPEQPQQTLWPVLLSPNWNSALVPADLHLKLKCCLFLCFSCHRLLVIFFKIQHKILKGTPFGRNKSSLIYLKSAEILEARVRFCARIYESCTTCYRRSNKTNICLELQSPRVFT